jgi:hypothetical protein
MTPSGGEGSAELGGRGFDVAVVGGGLAGVSAALASAGRGARTLLLERSPYLGGNAAGAFVHTFCGLYHAESEDEPRFANPGLAGRFTRGLRAAGGAGEPERAGRVWVLPTDPPAIARHAQALCEASPGLDLRLGCSLVAARLAQRASDPSALVLEVAGGGARLEVTAGVVVDASGDGALGTLSDAQTERAPDAERQLPSYIVRLAGVPSSDTAGYGRLRLSVAVAGAAKRRDLPADCDSVLLRPAGESGEAYLTLNVPRSQVEAAGAHEPAARRALEAWSRTAVQVVLAHLRKTRPGYAQCRVVAWPDRLGVREGARLVGRETIEADAVLAGRRREDEVAVSTWPIELWHDHRGASLRHPAGASGIPLGALVSRSHPRLGMAGRCLSASHEALGALRVLGTALATGEAIGLVAALAVERGVGLAEVAPEQVRQARSSETVTSRAR